MAFLGIAPLGNLAAGALAKAIGVQACFFGNFIFVEYCDLTEVPKRGRM